MKQINRKTYGLMFSTLVSIIMSLFMSAFMLWINLGIPPNFIALWIKSTLSGFVVAWPVAVLIIPILNKWLNQHFKVID